MAVATILLGIGIGIAVLGFCMVCVSGLFWMVSKTKEQSGLSGHALELGAWICSAGIILSGLSFIGLGFSTLIEML